MYTVVSGTRLPGPSPAGGLRSPLPTGSRADDVYEMLRGRILEGELKPDEFLVEDAIAKAASVSRTPVREALHRLEMDGLVQSRGRSVVVVGLSAEDLAELCIVQESLEGLAARLAALARSEIDVTTLQHLLSEIELVSLDDDVTRLVDLDHAFHESIWTSARNRYLAQQLMLLRTLIERRDSTPLANARRREEALVEHAAIVHAIAKHDAEAAEAASKAHFRNALARRMLNASLVGRRSTGLDPAVSPDPTNPDETLR